MRYSVIAPLITGLSDDYDSLTAFFNTASAKGVILPSGKIKHYAPGTIEKWYRDYKDGGFDALIPSGRSDIGQPRKLDEDIKEQIKYLKNNYPRIINKLFAIFIGNKFSSGFSLCCSFSISCSSCCSTAYILSS